MAVLAAELHFIETVVCKSDGEYRTVVCGGEAPVLSAGNEVPFEGVGVEAEACIRIPERSYGHTVCAGPDGDAGTGVPGLLRRRRRQGGGHDTCRRKEYEDRFLHSVDKDSDLFRIIS